MPTISRGHSNSSPCTRRRSLRPHPTSAAGLIGLLALALGLPSLAGAATITFDDQGWVHGQVVTGVPGVSILADNFTRSFDYAVVFDTEASGTADDDLEAFMGGGATRWSGGNLQGGDALGLALILQETESGCAGGVCDSADDEARRPAGTLSFIFDVPVVSFGFDLIDVDSTASENGSITFLDGQGGSVSRDFMTVLAALEIGNNTANRIAPFTAEALGLGSIDEVVITLGGSGAIDNVTYVPVPEPATAVFLGAGLAVLGLWRPGRERR